MSDLLHRQLPPKGKCNGLCNSTDIRRARSKSLSFRYRGDKAHGRPIRLAKVSQRLSQRFLCFIGKCILCLFIHQSHRIAVDGAGHHEGSPLCIALYEFAAGTWRANYICHTCPLVRMTKSRARKASVSSVTNPYVSPVVPPIFLTIQRFSCSPSTMAAPASRR